MKQTRSPRDVMLITSLFLLLSVLTISAALLESRSEPTIALASSSTAPDGAGALFQWLGRIGFTTSQDVEATFAVPDGTDLVFLLEPTFNSPVTDEDLEKLDEWVRSGGILIFASNNPGFHPIPEFYGFETVYLNEPIDYLPPGFPILTNPASTALLPVQADAYFVPILDEFLPLAAAAQGPVIVSTKVGDGTVILSASTHYFTNAGLKTPGSAAFILNLIDELPADALIWFDEWHHGQRQAVSGGGGPGIWLRTTPSGRALLFVTGVLFLFFALSGRSFGRPLTTRKASSRRSPLEFVNAMASLNQRADNRSFLLKHYHQQYKRRLGQRYHIDTSLSDEEFVTALQALKPDLDTMEIAKLLQDLKNENLSEHETIKRIREATRRHIRKS